MADEKWKNKDLPRANGIIAPSKWDPEKEKWTVYTGVNEVKDVDVRSELESIKQTQEEILERLDKPIDTNAQLTGSNVGYSDETKPKGQKSDQFLELDTKDVYFHDGEKWVKW